MRKLFVVALLGSVFSAKLFAAGEGPDIRIINDRVSVQADAVPLARLLRLLGQATGLESKVPPELANRNISVRFSNLSFADAIQKIFEGQPLDYVLIEGKSIVVTGLSQSTATTARNTGAPAAPVPENAFGDDNPAFAAPRLPINNPNQPAMIQTPFGAIPDPNARAPQQGMQGAAPITMPGQIQNPFNSTLPGLTPSNNNPYSPPSNNPFGQTPIMISPGTSPGAPTAMPVSPIPGNTFPGQAPPRLPNP